MLQNIFAQFYGGKRPFLRSIYYACQARFGVFAVYQQIEWSKVSRVIFVCKGNICRSAYAERKFISLGGSAVSAGLAADGKSADIRAQRVAKQRQVSLDNHHSRSVQEMPLASGDLLITFEPAYAESLVTLVRDRTDVQVTLLGLWEKPNPFWFYLHDPFGLSDTYFNNCFERIDRGLHGVLNHLAIYTNIGIKQ